MKVACREVNLPPHPVSTGWNALLFHEMTLVDLSAVNR
jgi:hypothetical protein